MKRPEPHEIDAQACRLFESKLPKEWVCRHQSSDYGIDYEVEIFKDNQTTGIIFKVQLKGTKRLELISDGTIISFSMPTNQIQYLVEEIQIPTFLIIVDVSTCQSYWLSMKGNKEVKQKLQEAKRVNQENITLHLSIKNGFLEKRELFLEDIKMSQADISAYLISSIDTSSFVQASKDCYNQDEILKQVRFKSDALRSDKLEKELLEGKYNEVIEECDRIYNSPSESIELRFSALFEMDKALGVKLYRHEERRIDEVIEVRLENAKRMRFIAKEGNLGLRIYAVAHYQGLIIYSLAHHDCNLFMNYVIHKNEKPFWLILLYIQRQGVTIRLNRSIRRMFNLINFAIKSRVYEIVPRLVSELCEGIAIYFIPLEGEGLENEASYIKLKEYCENAVNLGIAIAEKYNLYEEIAGLHNARVLIATAKEKEKRFKESISFIEKLPEFDRKKIHIEMLQRHLQQYKESLEMPQHETTIDEEEKIYRSMIKAQGIDLENQNDAIANILRIGLKDLNPERALKKCQHRFAKPTHCGLVGEIFKLPTAGSKMIYCTKHGYGINGIDLDRVDNTMNAVYCNKCPDRMLHPNDWNWTKKWQLEQNDKYGERFQH